MVLMGYGKMSQHLDLFDFFEGGFCWHRIDG